MVVFHARWRAAHSQAGPESLKISRNAGTGQVPRGYREGMTDQPVPDRSDNLTNPPKLDGDDAQLATGTGDPEKSDAGPSTAEAAAPAGDAPKPSPDI